MRNFKTKNLCIWLDQREHGYMRMDKWAKCGRTIDPESLCGRDVYIGIDLASTIDLASVGFDFPPTDTEKRVVLQHSFICEETYARRVAEGRYQWGAWKDGGFLEVTDGSAVDQEAIEMYIDSTIQKYGWVPREICMDPWNSGHVGNDLTNEGYTVVAIIQGMKTLSGPTKNLREEAYSGALIHDHDPVLNWAMGNAIARQDHNENIMLDKEKSRERIDPVAAIIDAHVRGMIHESQTGVLYFMVEAEGGPASNA